jgi:hypothetical protein
MNKSVTDSDENLVLDPQLGAWHQDRLSDWQSVVANFDVYLNCRLSQFWVSVVRSEKIVAETVREPRWKGMSAIKSRHQATAMKTENTLFVL